MELVADIVVAILLVALFILLMPVLFVAGVIVITINLLIAAYYGVANFLYNRKDKGNHFAPA